MVSSASQFSHHLGTGAIQDDKYLKWHYSNAYQGKTWEKMAQENASQATAFSKFFPGTHR